MFRIETTISYIRYYRSVLTAPASGILLLSGKPPTVIVKGMLANRNMSEIIYGNSKTYAFPNTATIVNDYAFAGSRIVSPRLNEGLETLEDNCFRSSKIKKLVLSSSVKSISYSAFN